MEETNLSTCRACNLVKVRILAGKFDSKNKKYVDENEQLWSGKYCPPCNKERIRNYMKELREKRRENSSDSSGHMASSVSQESQSQTN